MSPRSWTLSTKLVAGVVALYVAVVVAIGAATVLVMDQRLVQQVDSQLEDQSRFLGGRGGDVTRQCTSRPPGTGEGMLRLCFLDDGRTVGYLVRQGEYATLTAAQVQQVQDAGAGAARATTVDVGGLGAYRVVSVYRDGTTVVTGMPLGRVRAAVEDLLRTIVLASLTGLALMTVLGTWLVRSNLRPLRRVAETANRVSRMELTSGEVALAERVPPQDTDPRTEVGQVGSALNALLDHVDDALNARHRSELRVRQFVADASHELRTPLASIRGYAELSRREREPVPAGVRHALDRIESEAQRMGGLVEDLLLLARLDAGRPLEHAPVDLTMMLVEAVGDIRAAAPDHHWQLRLPDEAVEVAGDAGRLRQVVVNLLGNARAHTPAGTTVVAGLDLGPDAVRLSVHDDGPGIPPALLPDLFQRFTRGDESRNRAAGSTGLGLSIVDAVVTAHGGTVGVESVPGSTTFTVTLPRG